MSNCLPGLALFAQTLHFFFIVYLVAPAFLSVILFLLYSFDSEFYLKKLQALYHG